MFFKSFREKRRQENEYFDQLIEEAREEERLQLLAEESRWGEKWDHKIEALEFNEKEQELLSSFSEKVYCAQMAPEVFKDEVALSISTKLDLKPALETINPLCFLTSLANHHYVTEIRHYLKRNPRASVVDITCGLSTLFYQVYNKKLTWFNIDEDNILNLRNKLGLDDHKSIKQISITPPPRKFILVGEYSLP